MQPILAPIGGRKSTLETFSNGSVPIKMTRPLVLIFALACALAPTSPAQPSTPEEVAVAYTEAITAGDLALASQFFHPDALSQFKDFFIEIAHLDVDDTEDFESVFGFELAEIESMTPEVAFQVFMGFVLGEHEELAMMLQDMTLEVIGHVMEGEDLAHVVSRNRIQLFGFQYEQVDVVSLQLHEGQWMMLLSAELAGMIEMMRYLFDTDPDFDIDLDHPLEIDAPHQH